MDRGREAESASGGNENDEYYEFTPLGFLEDSYFTQSPYHNYDYNYSNHSNENAQIGLGHDPSPNFNYPPSAPQTVEPTGHSPYYPQTPMDLDVLSADNYQRDYAPVSSMQRMQRGREPAPLFGITADNRLRTISPSPPTGTRARRSRKESLKGTSVDEASSARQRGRPRLDTKDQTAAERRRTQIRLAQRAYRQRKETTISGLNDRVASLEKTVEDMHKTFLEFNDRAIASGIQKGAPALAGHLKSIAERLGELAKNSTEESDGEEDENDPGRSIQPVAAEPSSRRQGRELGLEPTSMLGYQTTFGEEEDEEEEDAGEITIPPAQLDNLPLSDRLGTEYMQQLRSENPKPNTRGINHVRPVQQNWVDVMDNNIEQFLRSKGLYVDGQYSVAETFGYVGPTDPSLGSEETPLPAVKSPYRSPSINSSGGPHTPQSTDAHGPNEPYLRGHHLFWNDTTNVSKASHMDMNVSFDDPSIRL
ncbi:MAG: hypothetical protein ASARMPREDX12_006966 [Alectoria sarmentosa]|nr:MAG: hypothetical protein ASARMPREDX12_006966 [Alectoria sarmentosa]